MEKKIKLSRTKNTIRNIIAGTFNRIILIFLPFILKTILIKKIGIEYAGLNGLFSSILQVLNLSELGFASAVVYSMYKPIAEDDKETICALLNFYKKAYFAVGLVILAAGACLMPFLSKLIKGNIPSDVNIYTLYSIFLINTSISYLLFGYKNSLLNAHQRRDIISNIMTITQGLMYVAQIVILLLTQNYYAYVFMMPIFTVLNNIIVGIETKRCYPLYSCKGTLSKEIRSDIKKKVSGLMISKISQTSRNSLDNIFISTFLGLTTTAVYSNYFLIITSITSFLNIITNSMQAGIGNSIQTESIEKNFINLKKIDLIYVIFIGWCSTCMLCIYQPFMELWMGKEYMFSFPTVILFAFSFYCLKTGDINSLFYNAAGLWWKGRYRASSEAILNLIGNYFLVKLLGINGVILATILTTIIGHYWSGQIIFKLFFKNKKMINYFLFEIIIFIVNICICIFIIFLCNLIKTSDTISRFILTSITCISMSTILFGGIYLIISKKLNLEIKIFPYFRK